MKILSKKLKAAVLVSSVALGMMFGTTQQSKAAFYPNYLIRSSNLLNLYHLTGNIQFYWAATAYHYYYLAGYFGDLGGYRLDPFGFKSTTYGGSTWAAYYYDTFAYWGDYYARF
jgi:hypothetical protein